MVSGCKVCAEIKLLFAQGNSETLIKVTQPMKRLSVNFKGLLLSSTSNKYLLVVIVEYSQFLLLFRVGT